MSSSPPDPAFVADGSLRDIYVAPATLSDWQKAFEFIRLRGQSLQFTVDGVPAALPAVDRVFAYRPAGDPLLHFELAGISVACHFFDPAELEFDLAPNSVRTPQQVAVLRSFLSGLANTLGKKVRLTPENRREEVLWRILPALPVESSA